MEHQQKITTKNLTKLKSGDFFSSIFSFFFSTFERKNKPKKIKTMMSAPGFQIKEQRWFASLQTTWQNSNKLYTHTKNSISASSSVVSILKKRPTSTPYHHF